MVMPMMFGRMFADGTLIGSNTQFRANGGPHKCCTTGPLRRKLQTSFLRNVRQQLVLFLSFYHLLKSTATGLKSCSSSYSAPIKVKPRHPADAATLLSITIPHKVWTRALYRNTRDSTLTLRHSTIVLLDTRITDLVYIGESFALSCN